MSLMEGWYRECLGKWTKKHRRAPSLEELADWCNKARSTVYSALISLEHKGYVSRDNKRHFVVVR